MSDKDENYTLFKKAYTTENFFFAGKLVYQIISTLPELKDLSAEEWQNKFSQLVQFLHHTKFAFESPDAFYEMLATIAVQLRRNPRIDWKVILN